MKPCNSLLTFFISASVLLSSCTWPVNNPVEMPALGRNTPATSPTPYSTALSPRETEELRRLVPIVLAWAHKWRIRLSCYRNVADGMHVSRDQNGLGWLQQYKELRNKEIEMRVEPTLHQIDVMIDALEAKITFNRFTDSRLESLRPEKICEPAQESASDDNSSKIGFVRSSPKAGVEVAKKAMLGRVVDLVKQTACISLSYSPSKDIKVTIPDFEVGEPEMYVLLEGERTEYSDGSSISWIRLDLNHENSEYQPVLIKNFGLPDEVAPRKKLIRANKYESLKVNCQ